MPSTYGKTRWRGGWACGCMIQSIEDIIEPRLRKAGMLRANEQVRVFQYAYSTGVSASGNTHAGGGSLDHKKGNDAETKIWRQCGVADWQRGAPQDPFFSDHNHGIWQGCPHLSGAAERQVVEYRNGDDGLAGDGSDDSPHVAPITWQAAYNKYKPLLEEETGFPLMAGETEEVWINYHADQPLAKDTPGYVHINDEKHTSLVTGTSKGVDLTAVIEFGGLKENEWAHIYWRRVWKKTGADDQIQAPDYLQRPAVPYRGGPGATASVSYRDNLPKADTGWTACIRLLYLTNSATAFIARRQISGWKLM